MPIPKPPYPAHFREQMVELAQAGHKPAKRVKGIGCDVASIPHWERQSTGGATASFHRSPLKPLWAFPAALVDPAQPPRRCVPSTASP